MAKKAKKSKATNPSTAAEKNLAKLDETGQRRNGDRRVNDVQVEASQDRRKVKRRRQIDPTTCEREYSEQEIEFMRAMDEYKRASGRMFPTCSEILEVLTNLGYRQIAEGQPLYSPDDENKATEDDQDAEADASEFEESVN